MVLRRSADAVTDWMQEHQVEKDKATGGRPSTVTARPGRD